MITTKKCLAEVEKLQERIDTITNEIERLQRLMPQQTNYRDVEIFRKEIRVLINQLDKKQEKQREVKSMGISSSEKSVLLREASKFITIHRVKDMAGYSCTAVGWSKSLGMFVKVSYHKYSSFMRNVKGCHSLADTTHLDSFEQLTESEVDEFLKAGRTDEVKLHEA